MCLTVSFEHHPQSLPLIAKKDILVWKVIYLNNFSKYLYFRYNSNQEYSISEGSWESQPLFTKFKGFHAYRNRYIARSKRYYDDSKIVKFWIPKGTPYFIGMHGDIVSMKIRSGDLKHNR